MQRLENAPSAKALFEDSRVKNPDGKTYGAPFTWQGHLGETLFGWFPHRRKLWQQRRAAARVLIDGIKPSADIFTENPLGLLKQAYQTVLQIEYQTPLANQEYNHLKQMIQEAKTNIED